MKTVGTLFTAVGKGVKEPSNKLEGQTTFGRVVDIILDETHPDYKIRGGVKSLNGVYYDLVESTYTESQDNIETFAYQSDRYVQRVPKVGEIIILSTQPTVEIGIEDTLRNVYYTGIVNVWNHPKDNISLDTRKPLTLNTVLQAEFKDDLIYSPVKSNQGDIHLLGRQGQSLRFTGAGTNKNPYIDSENIDKPLAIFRLGSTPENMYYNTVVEDINKDFTSIYFTSDHIIPLKTVRSFEKGYKEMPVIAADKYRGEQIVMNTGRFVLNAKHDSILLAAKDSLAITTGTMNIFSKEYIAIESSKIYLGQEALKAEIPEPVLLGNITVRLLDSMLRLLANTAKDLTAAQTVDGMPIPLLNKRGAQMQGAITQMQETLLKVKSTKVFVE
jgi:hypothetical protein